MRLSNNVGNIELAFTVALRIEAEKRKANGEDIIDLGLGDIQFGQPPKFTQALISAAKKGTNYYSEPNGILELREAIAHANNTLYSKSYQNKIIQPRYAPKEIVHATSAKLLIFASAISIANPNEEIIVIAPYCPSYIDTLKLAGIIPKICYTKKENKFFPTNKQLESLITEKTKGIIVNSPNNPTGRVYTEEELKIIASFVDKHDLFVISDEVYDTIVFDENKHLSIAVLDEKIAQRTIIIKGLSKGFGMGGMRFGYAISKNKDVIGALNRVISNTITSAPSLLQEAGISLFLGSTDHIINIRENFQKRVNFIEGIFKKNKINFTKVEGAPYIFPEVSSCFNKGITNSREFIQRLIKETGVVVLDGGVCGEDNHIRIALIQDLPILEEACKRLIRFIEKYKK